MKHGASGLENPARFLDHIQLLLHSVSAYQVQSFSLLLILRSIAFNRVLFRRENI